MRVWFGNICTAVATVIRALWVTMRYWVITYNPRRRTFTEQYEFPELPVKVAPRYRGFHRFDLTTCIACDACAGPARPIAFTSASSGWPGRKGFQVTSFTIDYGKCLFCALCVEPCPVDCIFMGWSHDLSCYSREGCAGRFFPASGGDCLGPGDARSAGGGQFEGGHPTRSMEGRTHEDERCEAKTSGARTSSTPSKKPTPRCPWSGPSSADLVELSRRRDRSPPSPVAAVRAPPAAAAIPIRKNWRRSRKSCKRTAERLREFVDELRRLGIEPTNGSEGLVDFPALIDGRKVFLCWKLGEPQVRYWHEPDAGYRQRHPLRLRVPVRRERRWGKTGRAFPRGRGTVG